MTELETLIREYARDLRRNSSGGDDYPWEIMIGVADYLEVLIGRAALTATPAVGGEAERLAQADADYQRKRYGEPPKPIADMDFETRDELLRKANYLLTFIAQPASPLRGRDEIIDACARLIEENQETCSETVDGTRRHLTPRKMHNLAGLAYADGIRSLLSASPPEQPAAAPEVQFLLDRLEEYDPEDEDHVRDFHGHVAPAIARLRNAVTNTSDGMISVNRETDFQVSPIKSDGETKA